MSIKPLLRISLPLAAALAALILSLTVISALADGPIINTQTPSPAISTVFGQTIDARTGHSLATGDVNGDGYQDLVIGAPYADLSPLVPGPNPDDDCLDFGPPIGCTSGAVYLFLGRSGISQTIDLLTQPANVTFYTPPDNSSGEELGRSLAVGDLNGDGFDDIIMGVSHYGASPIGAAMVWVGRTSITTTSTISINLYAEDGTGYNLKFVSAWTADHGGWDVAVGDLNNDTYDDLIVGMPMASVDPISDAVTDPPTDTTTYSPPDYQRYHFSSPSITRTENGAAYVRLGSPDLSIADHAYADVMICLPELTIYGQNDNDHLGHSVASGDIDGDGFDDLIVSAEGADSNSGKVYVFYGQSFASATCGPTYDNWIVKDLAYITTTADITLTGVSSGHAGYDVSTGNLNNDAFEDIIIAAPFANGNEGQVFVVYGRTRAAFPQTLPLTSQADVTVSGAAADTWLGTSVLAGDLNHDAIDDLLLGAIALNPDCADDPKYPGCGSEATGSGTAYALFGGSLNNTIDLSSGTPANLTVLGPAADDLLGRGLGVADFNNDSFNELFVGVAGLDHNGRTDTGAAYLLNLAYPQQLTVTGSLAQVDAGNSVSFTSTAQTWLNLLNVTPQTSFAISPAAGGSWTNHIYTSANPGTWTVTATFNSVVATTSLTVLGSPVPSFTCGSCTIGESQSLAFDAAASLGNAPLSFSWVFGDGASGSGLTTNHAYPDNSIYTAILTVQDTNGLTNTTQRLVTITNRAPVINSITNSGPITAGASVTITVSASDVPSDTLTYAFDCDNNASFEIGPQASNQASCSNFVISGTFTVNARVSDEDAGSAQGSTSVQVTGDSFIKLFLPVILK